MGSLLRALRVCALSGAILAAGACNGGLGNILGGMGGQQNQTMQINGTVRGLDSRNSQVNIQDNSNGQTYWVQYDNRTQVVYRNQNYPATAIRQGDNVTARVQNNGNNAYYADYIQIN